MDEYREALDRLVKSGQEQRSYRCEECNPLQLAGNQPREQCAYHAAKALLARPEPKLICDDCGKVSDRDFDHDEVHRCLSCWSATLSVVEPAAAEKAREWRPISEAERQTQYLLYAPPESIHRNPRGKPGQYRVSSPQSFVWASHFMPLPSLPAATGETKCE